MTCWRTPATSSKLHARLLIVQSISRWFSETGCWASALRKSIWMKTGAEYGEQVIRTLSAQLTAEYGGGFDLSSLYKYLRFYRVFPILDTLCTQSGNMLSWSHYRALLQVTDPRAREWYLNEAEE